MRSLSQVVLISAAGLATAGTIGTVGATGLHKVDGTGETAASAPSPSPDELRPIVETFEYPDAAGILERQGIRLFSGDGNIVLADCATPPVNDIGVLKVYSMEPEVGEKGRVCFKVLRDIGYLKLELPSVYSIRGDGQVKGAGHKVTAILKTEEGTLPPVAVNPTEPTPVGIGQAEDETMLLELRAKP